MKEEAKKFDGFGEQNVIAEAAGLVAEGLGRKEPLSGNLVLQVTPCTSLKLRGRTAELPRSDFNRQVIRFTRHALLMGR